MSLLDDQIELWLTTVGSLMVEIFRRELLVSGDYIQQTMGHDPNYKDSNLYKTATSVLTNLNSVTLYAEDYAKWLDRGRAPGVAPVPIWALIRWIQRKGITAVGYTTNQLAWAIQKSIVKKGIIPRDFLEPTFQFIEADVLKLFDTEFVDIFFESFVQTFQEL
jgi:hypothetical protein